MRSEGIIILALISIALLGYMLNLLGQEVLIDVFSGNKDHYILGMGRGISMLPAIQPGDIVIIDTKLDKIQIGDVIVYQYGSKLIGHRVVAVVQEGYITKGDNNPYPDNLVPTQAVVGKVVWQVKDPNPIDLLVLSWIFGAAV